MEETSKLIIEFDSLLDKEKFTNLLQWPDIPKEQLAWLLKGFYAIRLWQYINDKDYEWIASLEWVLELHNLIQGKETQ